LNYGESPSGSNEIDKILKDNYCKSKLPGELIEWVPYNEFKDITLVVREKSLKLYSASCSNSYICYWNKDKRYWSRKTENNKVMLMIFNSLIDLSNYKYEVSF
jgi:hypothetical protein